MNAADVKAFLRKQLEGVKADYLKDLEAMSHDQLDSSPGGKARCPYDFTYEVSVVNERIAKRLRREDPGPWEVEGWVVAPEEFRSKQVAADRFSSSMDQVIGALDSLDANALNEAIPITSGTSTPLDLVFLIRSHCGYHDAQLNYIQSMNGDSEVHW